MLGLLADPSAWAAFVALTLLEVVLGIDNIVFLSILVSRLPAERQRAARLAGLGLAMLTRIALLFSVTWLIALRAPLFGAGGHDVSSRDLALFGGGLFLLWKSVVELRASVAAGRPRPARAARIQQRVTPVVLQIAVVDVVFSLDSVFTAIGLAQRIEIMVAAIVLAAFFMMFVAGGVGRFIDRNPTIRALALAFLILIGVALIADAFEFHIPRAYLYLAMGFAAVVEFVRMRLRRGGAEGRT